ncbi:phage antirepressor KilAC domain-containing protein [Bacillus sp. B-jedd]|uniref:phage antirepressor KilAC domain-containing protein n=1 Tax=Bacillus sp. B-jedd TaxID=1476857 RepID=UPI0005155DC8|nr:phage antirepressor KilAC domain-containing protein [Bacillus sp. B-jedd]CEG29598.1 phage anti-repressor protein [Bacillus sp. B-jedd]
MQELITTTQNDNGEIIVSGRVIHNFLEVKTDYRKWFSRMAEYGFEENADFIRMTQKCPTPGGLQETVDHHIKLDMAKEIAMLQRSEKGKQARQYFIHLERMWNSPEMVMKRALEFADRQVKALQVQLTEQKPKVLFAEALETSKSSILIGELAKLLKQNGISIGQNRLFQWLRDNGFLIRKRGELFNLPTQSAMEMNLFEIKKRTIHNPDGSAKTTRTPKVTGKGQIYFINKFLEQKKA